jgi:hypothetical protein
VYSYSFTLHTIKVLLGLYERITLTHGSVSSCSTQTHLDLMGSIVTVRPSRNTAVTSFSQGRDHYGRGETAWAVIKVKAVRLLDGNFKGGMVEKGAFC